MIAQAVHLVRVLPQSRGKHIEVALEQVGALGGGLTSPRAVAVFGQLQANDAYFARHGVPAGGLDITAADGVVYRYFAGRCFEFHPLAEFGALNARVAAKDVAGTERLANALLARAVTRPGRRARLGVLLPLRRRSRTMDVGDGPVGRGAGVRASRFAPARRRLCADARGDGGVQGGPHADDESRGGPLDPPLLLQLAGGSERAAAVGALTPDVRDGDG